MTDDELRKLVAGYKPSPRVLKDMANIRVLGTVGPSASGKTTLMKALVKASPDVKFILDETSRAPRPNEENGIDFLFRTKDEIIEDLNNGALVQIAVGPNGDLYCTRLSSYPSKATGVIALVPVAVKEFRRLPIKSFKAAFIVPRSFEVWQQWLAKQARNGAWNEEKMQGRLAEARLSFEFVLNDKDIQFILNDNINHAAQRLEQVAIGQPPADQQQAITVAKQNYVKLLELSARGGQFMKNDKPPKSETDLKKHIITIAGRPGSGKSTTAKAVATRLGFQHFSSGDLFRALAQERNLDLLRANRTAEESTELDRLVDGRLRDIGSKADRLVVDSRTAWYWVPFSFKVFLDLDLELAAKRILSEMDEHRLTNENVSSNLAEYALMLQHRLDSETRRYQAAYGINPFDMGNYDLVIDTSANDIEQVVKLVAEGFQKWLKR